MNRIVQIALFLFLVVGCTTNEFDRHDNHTIKIEEGLFFIREVAAGRVFEDIDKVESDWKSKAQNLCAGDYEPMIYQNGEQRYLHDSAMAFFLPVSSWVGAPRIEGVVRCSNSPLSAEESTEILLHEFYLLPNKP
jgi:hypothetical protein